MGEPRTTAGFDAAHRACRKSSNNESRCPMALSLVGDAAMIAALGEAGKPATEKRPGGLDRGLGFRDVAGKDLELVDHAIPDLQLDRNPRRPRPFGEDA